MARILLKEWLLSIQPLVVLWKSVFFLVPGQFVTSFMLFHWATCCRRQRAKTACRGPTKVVKTAAQENVNVNNAGFETGFTNVPSMFAGPQRIRHVNTTFSFSLVKEAMAFYK